MEREKPNLKKRFIAAAVSATLFVGGCTAEASSTSSPKVSDSSSSSPTTSETYVSSSQTPSPTNVPEITWTPTQSTEPSPTPSATKKPAATNKPSVTEKPQDITVYWVYAHPDDETLTAAGAIEDYQRAGYKNVIVSVTSGDATAVGPALGLSKEQVSKARELEEKAALSVEGIHNIIFLRQPDEGVTVQFVENEIEKLVSDTKGEVWFRGHSPYDNYSGLKCGNPDHCAIGTALQTEWEKGEIKNLRMYRISQYFNEPTEGTCHYLSASDMAIKQKMRAQYSLIDHAIGRYGIAGLSVKSAWAATTKEPECYDLPK